MIDLSSELYDTQIMVALEKSIKSLDSSLMIDTGFTGNLYLHSTPDKFQVNYEKLHALARGPLLIWCF